MPIPQFLGYLGWALLGSILFFLYSVYKGVQRDEEGFTWKKFWKGAIRVVLTWISLAIAVIFWDQISTFVFAAEEPVELNGWSSFLIGTMADGLIEKLLGGSKDAVKYLPKKKKTT